MCKEYHIRRGLHLKWKRIWPFFLALLLFGMLALTGCNQQTTTAPTQPKETKQPAKSLSGDQFALLQEASFKYLKDAKLDSMTVKDVYEKVVLNPDPSYFVVDVRETADFAKGNIPGSVNIPYKMTADPKQIANLPKDKQIIVVCYSGHTASQTAAMWGMLGYKTIPMINGMGGWTATAGLGSPLPEKAFGFPVDTTEPKAAAFELPTVKEKEVTDLHSLLLKRAQTYFVSGKGPVVNAKLAMESLTKKDNQYFFVDIRKAEDYKKGHINGAINIPYQTIADKEQLKKIPANKKVILVGYTGNDASQVQRVLNLLGYDTYALFQGMRVWTEDHSINGIAPISTEKVANYPTKEINVDINSGGGGAASCG